MRNLLLATAALFALMAPAYAQDTSGGEEEPYEGVYVGGSFGYSIQGNDVGESVVFDRNRDGNFNDTITTVAGANAFSPGFCNGRATSALPGNCTNDDDGIEYYVRAGADTQFGNIVLGFVGEFGKSEVRDSVSAFSTTPANYVFTRELDWNASIRARAGYAANTTLFYGTFGPTYGRIDNSFTSTNTANAFSDNGKSNSWGYTAGGGIEQKLGRNFSVGLEYLYTDLNEDDYVVNVNPGTAPATNPFLLGNAGGSDMRRSSDNFRWHSIRATAAFRF
ncbi:MULTISPECIES: outer membrane protein [unclassified Sphingomonas]|uniref:outer membrane protein n=1 Tax=unclassified Sphingomonas TaxID=196159 RepID=UPI00082DCD04|nr:MULTISPECIES: outer membrane beta-barrel protein [unclassified Sphingomonas]